MSGGVRSTPRRTLDLTALRLSGRRQALSQIEADLLGELTPKAVKPAAMPHATNRVATQPEKICTVTTKPSRHSGAFTSGSGSTLHTASSAITHKL